MVLTPVQPLKALFPMDVSPLPKVTAVIPVQPLKASPPTDSTEAGNVRTPVSLVMPLNMDAGMTVTLGPTVSVKSVHSLGLVKINDAVSHASAFNTTDVSELQPANALLPISVTFSPMVSDVMPAPLNA